MSIYGLVAFNSFLLFSNLLNIRKHVINVTYVTQAEKYKVLNGDNSNDIIENNVTDGQGSCLTLLHHNISHISLTAATAASSRFKNYSVITVWASGNSLLSIIMPTIAAL